MAKFDLYQTVTDKIIASIEQGTLPWVKPWKGDTRTGNASLPFNAVSGKNYRGVNLMLLSLAGMSDFTSNAYVTYKQAQKLGGNVKKGETGYIVVFWSIVEKKDSNGEKTNIPMLRYSTVFNVDQCEGIDPSKIKSPIVPEVKSTSALQLAELNGAKVNHGGDKAFYAPLFDQITMPHQDQFKSEDDYNATLFHELTHWTGHKSRCNRDFANRFGSEAYAFEELVAEMGAAMLCANAGIEYTTQHTAYIAGWLKVLKDDKRAIFTASKQAMLAVDSLTHQDDEQEDDSE